ncbi:hypothetical protein CCACVL1_20228 [Corchorus capsularis]|uniref:Uncharacterized protein n=1 Tax=Corchorus capsularis TaxID=210143 RepID=A0A1R3HC23_COCAP|nr:hypothetical protein CCACVL1_20228 [Corchorus capsularis]
MTLFSERYQYQAKQLLSSTSSLSSIYTFWQHKAYLSTMR